MTLIHGKWAVVDGDTHYAKWVADAGEMVHDVWLAEQLTSLVEPGQVAVDLGSNIGTLARALLDHGCEVHAFECQERALECLRHNCPEAHIYEVAVGETYSLVWVKLSDNVGASHLSPDGHEGVQMVPLDFYGLSPSLIKADIEGCETAMLRGAKETIARCRPKMFLEVNDFALRRQGSSRDELLELVRELGYEIRIAQPELNFESDQYDIICLPL